MYRLNKRVKHKKILAVILTVVFLLLIIAVWFFVINSSGSSILNQPGESRRTVDDGRNEVKFNESFFSITLPSDWELDRESEQPMVYYFRSTKKDQDAKTLVVYIDADTSEYSINRVLPVEVNKNKLKPGDISDTCVNFVKANSQDRHKGKAIGHWQGVNFLCDLTSENKNVIGIGSEEKINTVILNGPKSGKHSYFVQYTDHNIKPDFILAKRILSSLEAK